MIPVCVYVCVCVCVVPVECATVKMQTKKRERMEERGWEEGGDAMSAQGDGDDASGKRCKQEGGRMEGGEMEMDDEQAACMGMEEKSEWEKQRELLQELSIASTASLASSVGANSLHEVPGANLLKFLQANGPNGANAAPREHHAHHNHLGSNVFAAPLTGPNVMGASLKGPSVSGPQNVIASPHTMGPQMPAWMIAHGLGALNGQQGNSTSSVHVPLGNSPLNGPVNNPLNGRASLGGNLPHAVAWPQGAPSHVPFGIPPPPGAAAPLQATGPHTGSALQGVLGSYGTLRAEVYSASCSGAEGRRTAELVGKELATTRSADDGLLAPQILRPTPHRPHAALVGTVGAGVAHVGAGGGGWERSVPSGLVEKNAGQAVQKKECATVKHGGGCGGGRGGGGGEEGGGGGGGGGVVRGGMDDGRGLIRTHLTATQLAAQVLSFPLPETRSPNLW
jgi:hypothetical protein